jgi:hypothetical protein
MRRIALLTLSTLLVGCSSVDVPLPKADNRPTPLHFGLHVTPDPATNPIDPPERFTGYHAATDFEILKGEENKEVPVYAVCAGKLNFSGFSEGYGGLITQFCNLKGQDVTIIYGHLAVASLPENGIQVETGQLLGVLGAARSTDTDGSRKHLHLGILKGHVSAVAGYVQTEEELDAYLNPEEVLGL